MNKCACSSDLDYLVCCGRFIEKNEIPATPEELMRSRYTAYTQAKIDYIAKTMKSPASDHFNPQEAETWAKSVEWNKLEVIESTSEGAQGFVEFLAYFYDNGKRHVLHERSEFHLESGQWFYINGIPPKNRPLSQTPRLSRNDPCHCNSGKKYKKCCGKP